MPTLTKRRGPRRALLCSNLAALLLAVSTSHAQIVFAPIGDHLVRLIPGEEGTLGLRIQGGQFDARVWFSHAASGEYETTGVLPAPGCPALNPMSGMRLVAVDTGVAGAPLDCIYRIRRNLHSINDLDFQITVPSLMSAYAEFQLGVVADIDLSVDSEAAVLLPDGRAQSTVSIRFHNASPVALTGARAGFCLEGMPQIPLLDGAISDGCGDSHWHGVCFSGGYGFRVAAPAYSSGTCRVRVTTRETYTAPVHYPINLIPTYMTDVATGGHVLSSGTVAIRSMSVALDPLFANGFE